ncbi:Nuclease harbi1-like protein [Camponotus japonicus]
MACCDANYCFTWVEIGDYGSLPDSIFANSGLGKALETNSLNFPPSKELPNITEKIPHFFVGDDAFPLRTNLMRPYSRKGIKSDRERIFNYRLSRARRIIENAFGILSSRWRVFHSCIYMKEKNVEKIVLPTICLHNFLMMPEDREVERKIYCLTTYIDDENDDGSVLQECGVMQLQRIQVSTILVV